MKVSSSSCSSRVSLISPSLPSQLFNNLSSLSSLSSSSYLYSLLSECFDPSSRNGLIYDHILDILSIQNISSSSLSNDDLLQHPLPLMNSASIIDFQLPGHPPLTSSQKQDSFINLLLSTYKNSKHDQRNQKYKLTIVLINGLTETYEFIEMKSYWKFISAICKSNSSINHPKNLNPTSYRGKCFITNSELIPMIRNPEMKSSAAHQDYETFLDLSQNKLDIRPNAPNGNGKLEPHTFDLLTDIRAIGLHSDYEMPHPLELQFSSFSCSLHDMDGHVLDDLQLTVSAEINNEILFTKDIDDVSDNIFFSMLVPNNLSLVLKLIIKHDITHDHSSTMSHHSQLPPITLGKMNLPIHSFIPFHSPPSPAVPSSQHSATTSTTHDLDDTHPLSLPPSSFPISMMIDIPIAPPDMDLIAKLSIYHLENIPLSSSGSQTLPPNVYCVVYIVGRDGKVIESIGNKTVPIKSCNPVWNVEFLLHTHLGISEIESVLVKVKDANVGTFRHKHLGQIELPIDVFLPTHPPAQLKLPLMPTERMRTESNEYLRNDSLGEILVGTQLVKTPKVTPLSPPTTHRGSLSSLFISVDPTPPVTSSHQLPTPEIKNISQTSHFIKSPKLNLRSMSVDENDIYQPEPAPEGGVVKFRCELKHISPSSVWWPCLGLSEVQYSGTPITTEGTMTSRWDHRECLFALNEFLIRNRKRNGDENSKGESLRKTMDRGKFKNDVLSDDDDRLDEIRIPWSQVCCPSFSPTE
jgi:hypothetical protein